MLVALAVFLYFENNAVGVTHISIQSRKLPQSFDGYKIVHLSDLHGKSFGGYQQELINQIKKLRPNLIVFTGDLVDKRHYDPQPGINLMEQAAGIAPVYYVTGNHEWASGRYGVLEKSLKEIGIKVLRNASDIIRMETDNIYVCGIDDPSSGYHAQEEEKIAAGAINDAIKGIKDDAFKILLAHRPEMFALYGQYGFDLVLAGHAHGGQVRLVFVGGVVAPNQGFFPRYSAGKYAEGNSNMVVSRGLGNSIIPQRLFNRPEVVVVTLQTE